MSTTSPSPSHPIRSALHALGEDLRHDVAAVREANTALREAEGAAWHAYAEQVDAIVHAMEHDLAEQREALADDRSERAAEVHEAFDDLVERAHRALDEARVQEALAELEVRDVLGERWETLTGAVTRLQATVRSALTDLRRTGPRRR